MRAIGAHAVEMVIDHIASARERPAAVTMSRAETERLLRTPIPEQGESVHALLDTLSRDVFPHTFQADHPRFYAFVPSTGNYVSAIGDFLASAHNIFAGHWMASSTAAQVEITVLGWLQELCGYPADAGGIFLSGGSMANLSAIAVARERKLGSHNPRAVVYCSDQTHSSMAKGLRIIGFAPDQRRTIACDADYRLSVPELERAIERDRANGLLPFAVVANGGTTDTGAVDPLEDLADLCKQEGLWLHVDGAYGAAAVITERGRAALRGLGRADSITLDPHKWLFQPFELGCLLVREPGALEATFTVRDDDHANYLTDVRRHISDEVNFFERGAQLTRSFKALKLWLSLRAFGISEFRRAIDIGLDLAEAAERMIAADHRWAIVTPARMGIVTFRWVDTTRTDSEIDAIQAAAVDRMASDGYALVMSTILRGKTALRLCPIHPGATEAEVAETLRRMGVFAEEASARLSGGSGV